MIDETINLRFRVAWASLEGQMFCTPTSWLYAQAEAVLAGAREIADLCGSHLTFWLEATLEGKPSYAGWE